VTAAAVANEEGLQPAWSRRRLMYVRDLVSVLVARDLKSRYKRSLLGFAWSLLNPLAQMLVISFVFSRVFGITIPDYPLFVFCAILPWTWFQSSLVAATDAITGNREMIRRPGFPVPALPVITVASNLLHFLLALPILLLFLVLSGRGASLAVLGLPVLVALQFVLTLGLAYFVATFQVTFRDTQHLLTVALLLVFYLTPVFYLADAVPAQYRAVYALNPMVHLIEGYRAALLGRGQVDPLALVAIAAVGGVLLWIGYGVFVRASYGFAEEL
jgi:lipopolysaccharide transport system permease protein